MSVLSDEDRGALLDAYCRHSPEGRRQVGTCSAAPAAVRCELMVTEVAPAVKAIVGRHVTAALTEAAEAVETWEQMNARWAESGEPNEQGRIRAKVRVLAYGRAARIVRARIPTT